MHGVETPAAVTESLEPPVAWTQRLLRLLRQKPLGAVGAVIVLGLLVLALGADVIAPFHYNKAGAGERFEPPSFAHVLGTDNLGRDIWSRIVYGARISMSISLGAVCLGTVFAIVLGVVSGYYGGVVDMLLQRIVDAWMAFPWLVFVLSVMAVVGPSIPALTVALSVLVTANGARVMRAATLTVMTQTYMEAARAAGAAHGRILRWYIVPNVMASVIVMATVAFGTVILAEAALSFLGFGVPSPYPSWGRMLNASGRSYMIRAPWMVIWAGVAISVTVFAFNVVGDTLRDILDPRLRGGGGRSA